MTAEHHIRNPFELMIENATDAARAGWRAIPFYGRKTQAQAAPEVRRIGVADLKDALREGWEDLGAYRSDILFLALVYPIAGLLLAQLAYNHDFLPLLFPLVSGFALIGPFAAVGLYEISRRREQGAHITWLDAFAVFGSPAFGRVMALGVILFAIFLAWVATAYEIFILTLGPERPLSPVAFFQDVFITPAGWTMIAVGVSVGFLFAVATLAISVVSFPLMLDRDVGVWTAITTSVRAVAANRGAMAVWGLIVAGALVLGSIPALVGLIVVMPLLGHATWRLYRKLVA